MASQGFKLVHNLAHLHSHDSVFKGLWSIAVQKLQSVNCPCSLVV